MGLQREGKVAESVELVEATEGARVRTYWYWTVNALSGLVGWVKGLKEMSTAWDILSALLSVDREFVDGGIFLAAVHMTLLDPNCSIYFDHIFSICTDLLWEEEQSIKMIYR